MADVFKQGKPRVELVNDKPLQGVYRRLGQAYRGLSQAGCGAESFSALPLFDSYRVLPELSEAFLNNRCENEGGVWYALKSWQYCSLRDQTQTRRLTGVAGNARSQHFRVEEFLGVLLRVMRSRDGKPVSYKTARAVFKRGIGRLWKVCKSSRRPIEVFGYGDVGKLFLRRNRETGNRRFNQGCERSISELFGTVHARRAAFTAHLSEMLHEHAHSRAFLGKRCGGVTARTVLNRQKKTGVQWKTTQHSVWSSKNVRRGSKEHEQALKNAKSLVYALRYEHGRGDARLCETRGRCQIRKNGTTRWHQPSISLHVVLNGPNEYKQSGIPLPSTVVKSYSRRVARRDPHGIYVDCATQSAATSPVSAAGFQLRSMKEVFAVERLHVFDFKNALFKLRKKAVKSGCIPPPTETALELYPRAVLGYLKPKQAMFFVGKKRSEILARLEAVTRGQSLSESTSSFALSPSRLSSRRLTESLPEEAGSLP